MMKNIKLIKDYYHTLSNKGKAVFALTGIVVVYLILDAVA